jgi:protein-L-isoaspartate(D-aspartate) O-methyltransferase
VYFVLIALSLIGIAGVIQTSNAQTARSAIAKHDALQEIIFRSSEHFSDIDSANLGGLLQRIADARVVLIGEASHGSAEFYDMRARITRELIRHKGFNIIAVEHEWPDAAVIDHFIRGNGKPPIVRYRPFGDFPSWLWSNPSFNSFLYWLKGHNRLASTAADKVSFYGLSLYNLFGSIDAVLNYLHDVDPQMAALARRRYDCLMPWANDPSVYSDLMEPGTYRGCGHEVHAVYRDLQANKNRYLGAGRQQYFNALQNALLAWKAEFYYRTRHQGIVNSWNYRDRTMFDTLLAILNFHGKSSKAVVWAHNTHVGDARATDMTEAGEINLGQLARERFANRAYLIGMGTDHGTVTAASKWGGPAHIKKVPPAHEDSYEHLFHTVRADNFILPLRYPIRQSVRVELLAPRLHRGIGSIYSPDPEKEMKYHYYQASLPLQFDEYIWFDETRAVKALSNPKNTN